MGTHGLKIATLGIALALVALSTASASADDFATFASFQSEKMSDAQLAQTRGMYVPPSQPGTHATVPLDAKNVAEPSNPLPVGALSTQALSSPLAGLQGSGQVVYFGVQMMSSWSVQNGPQTQGVTIGATVGIDPINQTLTVTGGSTSQNGGLPTLSSDGNTVHGSPPTNNLSGGVGQSIQVAGNTNDVTNSATLVVSASKPMFTILPTTTTCGASCTTTVGPNVVQIQIQTSIGTVTQQIGTTGATQAVQLAGNGNLITNTMTMGAQLQQGTGFSADSLLPIIQSINWSR